MKKILYILLIMGSTSVFTLALTEQTVSAKPVAQPQVKCKTYEEYVKEEAERKEQERQDKARIRRQAVKDFFSSNIP